MTYNLERMEYVFTISIYICFKILWFWSFETMSIYFKINVIRWKYNNFIIRRPSTCSLVYIYTIKVETIEYNSHTLFIYPSSHKAPLDGPCVRSRCLTKNLADRKTSWRQLILPCDKKIWGPMHCPPASVHAVRWGHRLGHSRSDRKFYHLP